MKYKELKRRIIEISYKHRLSHLGSCLTAVDIIQEIYERKKKDEKFVLSSGHAGLALYVVLESHGYGDAEAMFNHHGVHPDLCSRCNIDCSSGSLGHGLGIAVGMAIANRKKDVYCLISDGECSEGSIWEALRIARENHLDNLYVNLNFNRYGAYQYIPFPPTDIQNFPVNVHDTNFNDFPFLKGQDAHYYVMNEDDYKRAMNILDCICPELDSGAIQAVGNCKIHGVMVR